MTLPACPVCGQLLNDPSPHQCPGPNTQPVHEVAQAIVNGLAWTDMDALRVAREYLAVTGELAEANLGAMRQSSRAATAEARIRELAAERDTLGENYRVQHDAFANELALSERLEVENEKLRETLRTARESIDAEIDRMDDVWQRRSNAQDYPRIIAANAHLEGLKFAATALTVAEEETT